jgi:hypothetical protein
VCFDGLLLSQTDVDTAVAQLLPESRIAARWEIERLPEHLEPGERVGALAMADAEGDPGLLGATDRRLFFLNTESDSHVIKHSKLVTFAYADVEQLAFEPDGVVVTRRADTVPSFPRRRALTRIALGAGLCGVLGASGTGAQGLVSFLVGALLGGAAVAAAQVLTRRRSGAVPGWLAELSGVAPQLSFEFTAIPPQEAGALYEFLAAQGGPLEDRILDPGDVRTRAAIAAAEFRATGQPERWAVASIRYGAVVAVAAVVAFFAASAADCEERPWWLYAILLGPVLATVLVAVGYWGTHSAEVRNRARWVWAVIAVSFFLTWIVLPAWC